VQVNTHENLYETSHSSKGGDLLQRSNQEEKHNEF